MVSMQSPGVRSDPMVSSNHVKTNRNREKTFYNLQFMMVTCYHARKQLEIWIKLIKILTLVCPVAFCAVTASVRSVFLCLISLAFP